MSDLNASQSRQPALDLATCPLPVFAAAVAGAITRIGNDTTERFGARKVFVSAVYRALFVAGFDAWPFSGFKSRLIDAQRAGLLSLARADLVGAMPSATVAASEIDTFGATYHFVIDQSAREPWEVAS